MTLPDNVLKFIKDSCTEKYPALIQRHLVMYFGKDLPGGFITTEDVRELMIKFALEKGKPIIDIPAKFPDARHIKDEVKHKTGRKKTKPEKLSA
jgi:hypothetical protein